MDASGSMSGVQLETLNALNSQIESIRKTAAKNPEWFLGAAELTDVVEPRQAFPSPSICLFAIGANTTFSSAGSTFRTFRAAHFVSL